MRRFLVWIWFSCLAPMAALGLSPAEPPPADFPGRQYIDSAGCVFLRDEDGGWEARTGRDGAPVCGYPPSLSMRGLNGRPKLQALDPEAGTTRAQRIGEELARRLVPELRPGELASDPRPLEALPDMGPEPVPTGPLDALKSSLRAAPAIREAMTREIQPNLRLCRLLGHDGAQGAARDPSQGFCGALPDMQLSRLAFARPMKAVAVTAVAEPSVSASHKGKGRVLRSQPQAAPVSAALSPRPQLIPSTARYVQVGGFSGAAEGARMARRIAGLGYPVLRGRLAGAHGGQVILVGPFDSRQEVVQTLARIRRSGYPGAIAR